MKIGFGKTFVTSLVAVCIGAGAIGVMGAAWSRTPEADAQEAVYDGPALPRFDKGYVAPAGPFHIRMATPTGPKTITADISVGFENLPQARHHLEGNGLLQLREAMLLSLTDVAACPSVDAAEDWVRELAACLAIVVPGHLPGVIEVQVNSAARRGM